MTTSTRPSGVTITVPDGCRILNEAPSAADLRTFAARAADMLLHDVEAIDRVDLAPGGDAGGDDADSRRIVVEVHAAAHTSVVLLIEQRGVTVALREAEATRTEGPPTLRFAIAIDPAQESLLVRDPRRVGSGPLTIYVVRVRVSAHDACRERSAAAAAPAASPSPMPAPPSPAASAARPMPPPSHAAPPAPPPPGAAPPRMPRNAPRGAPGVGGLVRRGIDRIRRGLGRAPGTTRAEPPEASALPDAAAAPAPPIVIAPTSPPRAAARRAAPPAPSPGAELSPPPADEAEPPLSPQAPDGAEGGGAAAAPAPGSPAAAAVAAPARVECHVLAEMDPEVALDHTATIEVSLSRESLTPLAGRASASSGPVRVDATATLLVQVVPRVNFAVAPGTSDRVEVDPPAEGAPVLLYFDVVAKHPGAGEVWIIVRQHQMGVARLVLTPAIVERASAAPGARAAAEADAASAPPLERPIDQLSIFEQTIGGQVRYQFELEMPSINAFGLYTSAPLDVPRDAYVARLYKDIEERYVSTYDSASKTADVAAFTAELQAYGAVLFDRLLPREMQELLWTHRDAIHSVRVVSTEPFIPWEIVHLREPGRPVDRTAPARFLGQMGLVRWLYNVNGLPPARLRLRRGRARYVIPDYADPRLALPSTINERLYLEQTFGATAIEAQPNPLRAALSTPGTLDLVHFACHGEADSSAIDQARIVLAGRDEGEIVPTYMNASTIETFAQLRGPDGVQPIVFLNACQAGRAGYELTGIGGFAQAFLRAGAGAFVGTLWSVSDQPAFFFGRAFYDALRAGAPIAAATVAAREAARQDDATWLAYVVYAHPHATLITEP